MKPMVGHILYKNVVTQAGWQGQAYDYYLGGNGLFVRAYNNLLKGIAPVSKVKVPGLENIAGFVELAHGKIPQRLFDLLVSVFLAGADREHYAGIVWNDGYQLYIPDQSGSGARVEYIKTDNVVLEMHSHPTFGPGPSPTDNTDEQGFRIYGIVGELAEEKPSIYFRLGIYGHFLPLVWEDVFEGTLNGFIDVEDVLRKEESHDLPAGET